MNDEPVRMTDYACNFCLSKTEAPHGNPPDFCQHCHVSACLDCITYLKGDNPTWCYGCGKIKPVVSGRFTSLDGIAAHYMWDEWQKKNLSKYNKTQRPYILCTSIAPNKPDRFIGQHDENNEIIVIKALDENEIEFVKNNKNLFS